jgi:hypothetical protein
VQSPHIDLTQESSSDSSDISEDETITTSAQPVPPTPVEDISDTQNIRAADVGNTACRDANKHTASPKPTSATQEQPQPSSEDDHDDSLGLLISYCDNYQANINNRTVPSSDGSSGSPDCNVPFSTAPEYQGLPDLSDDEIHHDAEVKVYEDKDSGNTNSEITPSPVVPNNQAESTTSTPISYSSSPVGIEGFTSSPPVSYQLPLEMASPKTVIPLLGDKMDNESTMSMKDMPGSMKTHPARSVYIPQKRLSSSAYELQPVYSGEKLLRSHTPGTPSPFRPHHRDALIGLKGILKRSVGQQGHDSDNETVYSPFPDISPLSGDEYMVSSPSERVKHSKEQAKVVRPSENRAS